MVKFRLIFAVDRNNDEISINTSRGPVEFSSKSAILSWKKRMRATQVCVLKLSDDGTNELGQECF